MGGANRFMTLLTAPFPPLRPSLIILHRNSRSLSTTPLRLLTAHFPSKTESLIQLPLKSFHTQSSNNPFPAAQQQQRHHPWPEWTHFLNVLSNEQGFPANLGIPPEDAFVVYEELTADFVSAAAACLAFSRSRPSLIGSLSRRDIEAVVSNGTPFLFKSALDTARRMRAFLGTDGSNVPDFDKANTVDLMKYILSYASNPAVSSERNGLFSRELVDSSVRNLLHELGAVCSGVPTDTIPSSGHQFSGRDGQPQRPFGQNIEMKRGDWICPKCNFMNFAKNMKCLECEESRPKKQLTGGEWECPECTFFNYGRNMVCLRCDCRKPGAPLFNTNNSQFGSGHNGDYSYKTNMGNRSTGNEERAQQWFSKISQMNNATDSNNANTKVTTNSIPDTSVNHSMDHILGQSKRDRTSEMDDRNKAPIAVHETVSSETRNQSQIDIENKDRAEQAEKSERWFKKMGEMHDVKDLPSAVSDEDFPEIMPIRQGENRFVVSKKKDRSLTSPKYKRQVAVDQANSTNFVPFVPFPPGYFAKKDTEQINGPDSPERSTSSVNPNEIASVNPNEVPRMHNQSVNSTSSEVAKNENVRSSWTGTSLEGSAVKETDPLDMSEEAKAERWFKRVAQIKDISELSQIPDEDFPSIMPMRKGVNRFVVSKRKTPLERRLTSQQYRRNLPIVSTDSVNKESDNS